MVHALKEIWRVLTPTGSFIDLRPFSANCPVEVVTPHDFIIAGAVDDSKKVADDAAANHALAQAVQQGLFEQESRAEFDFLWYWDASEDMKAYYEGKSPPVLISDTVINNTRHLLADMGNEAKIRVRLRMLIARYLKRP